MATAVSMKRGWFYECLTELDLEPLRLCPSLLCSDPGHGNSLWNEAFQTHANHYVRVTVHRCTLIPRFYRSGALQ
ncbi:Hypothetical predicted protein [Scomber scombrus]